MNYTDYVNINQGTKSEFRFSNGNTLPLVQMPFGMAHIAPQTKGGTPWWYNPESPYIEGFRVTHQPSPWLSDYGTFLIAPQRDIFIDDYAENYSGARLSKAKLSPYLSEVEFLKQQCLLKATTSQRCVKVKAEFKDPKNSGLSIFNLMGTSEFEIDEKRGYVLFSTDGAEPGIAKNFKMFCAIKLSDKEADLSKAYKSGEAFHIPIKASSVEMDIGLSYLSFKQAKLNLSETEGKTFSELINLSKNAWEEYLSRIKLSPDTPEDIKKTFYSCLYRTGTYPNIAYEINENGAPVHYSPYTGKEEKGIRYVNNGFWDTSRTAFPLYGIIAKDIYRNMLISALGDYKESGYLPRWVTLAEVGCMPSTLIDSVISSGVLSGIADTDLSKELLAAMIKHAEESSPEQRFGREGIEDYIKLGYVPSDRHKESVNLTLDFAYGDYCIYKVAEHLGLSETAEKYKKRADNYKNIFDKETGFMRGRNADGSFSSNFDPYEWGKDYTEANAWQTTFSVPHDLEGLAALMGGSDKLISMIDKIFESDPEYRVGGYKKEIHEMTEMVAVNMGLCAINNQPSFSIPYIYAYFNEKEKSEHFRDKICKELFSSASDGFPGDEDNGSMAAWYILSMLGIYPICPGDNRYVKISPLVKGEIMGEDIESFKI